jgi:hypothetical protein
MARATKQLVICLDNTGTRYPWSEEKIYVAFPDASAAREATSG